jgi:very-short-patch-repair endonuclease
VTLPSPLAGEGDSAPAERGEGYLPLKKHARTMRNRPTDAERRLWAMLRDLRFRPFKFRRQVPIGAFIADFVCYETRLIVEADGGQHCESAADARRTAWLESQGYRVLRFWNHEILAQPRDVMDRLYTALNSPSPRSPSASRPLPRGEREESGDHV